jgi:cysteine desulfurase
MSQRKVYLDYAAATPMDSDVLASMMAYYSDNFYNPSATYLAAKGVSADIADARAKVAKWLGVKPNEIVFTAGGTEANNLAINGIMQKHKGSNIVISAIEHESVMEPAAKYDKKTASVKKNGIVDLDKLEKLIDDQTVLVSIMYANNEIGTIQPLKQVSTLINKIKRNRESSANKLPLFFHTDACQAAAYLSLQVSRLGVDLMTLNAGKIYGPKETGALFINRTVELEPQILGGGQEMGIRSGTENVSNIIGFSSALDLVQNRRNNEVNRLKGLQKYFIERLKKDMPEAVFNGDFKNRLPNNVHITLPGQDSETLIMKLDEMGIQCASGSACNASSDEISQTLLAIGLSKNEARSSLRFTFGKATTKDDLDYTINCLKKVV